MSIPKQGVGTSASSIVAALLTPEYGSVPPLLIKYEANITIRKPLSRQRSRDHHCRTCYKTDQLTFLFNYYLQFRRDRIDSNALALHFKPFLDFSSHLIRDTLPHLSHGNLGVICKIQGYLIHEHVVDDLLRELLENLGREADNIGAVLVDEVAEFDKLHDVSSGGAPLLIPQQVFVTVKILHVAEVVVVAHSDNYEAHWVLAELNYDLNSFLEVMEFAICQNDVHMVHRIGHACLNVGKERFQDVLEVRRACQLGIQY